MNLLRLTDEELAQHMQQNQGQGLEELINRYQDKLSRYSHSIVKDKDDVSDVLQETFISVFRNINSFDVNRKFSSWIYRIAHNKAINEVRKSKMLTVFDESREVEDEKYDGEKVKKEIDAKKTKKKLKSAIEKLPLKYKEVIVLRYFEEKSYEEISDILKIPQNTVGIRIKRGLEMLKRKLNIKVEDFL